MKIVLVLLAVIGLAGCYGNTGVDESADQLLQVDREFSRMSVEQGIDKAFDFYMADSAIMLRDSVPPVTGRDAINKLYEGIPEGTQLSWEALFADISSSGDLGYTIGRWQYSATDTVEPSKRATVITLQSGRSRMMEAGNTFSIPAPTARPRRSSGG